MNVSTVRSTGDVLHNVSVDDGGDDGENDSTIPDEDARTRRYVMYLSLSLCFIILFLYFSCSAFALLSLSNMSNLQLDLVGVLIKNACHLLQLKDIWGFERGSQQQSLSEKREKTISFGDIW